MFINTLFSQYFKLLSCKKARFMLQRDRFGLISLRRWRRRGNRRLMLRLRLRRRRWRKERHIVWINHVVVLWNKLRGFLISEAHSIQIAAWCPIKILIWTDISAHYLILSYFRRLHFYPNSLSRLLNFKKYKQLFPAYPVLLMISQQSF